MTLEKIFDRVMKLLEEHRGDLYHAAEGEGEDNLCIVATHYDPNRNPSAKAFALLIGKGMNSAHGVLNASVRLVENPESNDFAKATKKDLPSADITNKLP